MQVFIHVHVFVKQVTGCREKTAAESDNCAPLMSSSVLHFLPQVILKKKINGFNIWITIRSHQSPKKEKTHTVKIYKNRKYIT